MKRNVVSRALASGLFWALLGAIAAEPPSSGRIFTCTDAQGRKHVSQAPIPECADRDHVQRNSDGSIRGVIRKPLTEKEREVEDAKAREAEAACRDRKIEERAQRNLIKRYPNRAAHDLARQEALNDVAKSMDISRKRIDLLLREKRKLDDEAEFYVGKDLPAKLKLATDRNDSALEAQNKLVAQQKGEVQRINARLDDELASLQKLWRSPPPPLNC